MQPVVGSRTQVKHSAANSGRECASLAQHRRSMGIQVIERIPGPNHLQVSVQDQNRVSDHVDWTWSLYVSKNSFRICQHEVFAIRELSRFVMEAADRMNAQRNKLLVHARSVCFRQCGSGEIELPEELL